MNTGASNKTKRNEWREFILAGGCRGRLKLVGIGIDHKQMGSYGRQTENLIKIIERILKVVTGKY